jgi:hypothetical protein
LYLGIHGLGCPCKWAIKVACSGFKSCYVLYLPTKVIIHVHVYLVHALCTYMLGVFLFSACVCVHVYANAIVPAC